MRLILTAAALMMTATSVAAAPPSAADRAAMEKLALDSDRDWDLKALDRFTAHHVGDSSVRIAGAPAVAGHAAVRAYFDRLFAQRPDGFRHISKLEEVEMLDHDTALADTYVRVERRQPDGSWALQRDFRTYSVVVRSGSGWKIRSVRAAPLPKPAA